MKTRPPSYRVRLFSDPLLEGPGGECHLSPYQSALLTLVFAEGTISRPKISKLLWRTEVITKTRPRIRQLKSEIRRRAGAQVVSTDGDLLIPADGVVSDLQELEAHISGGRLAPAAKIVRDGLSCPQTTGVSDALDDWKERYCSDLKGRVTTLASAKWVSSHAESDWAAARDAAEACYALRPRDPEVVARVIEARARVGRPRAAEVAYAEFKENVTTSSSESVDRAIRRVRALDEPGASSSRPIPKLPFVGRKAPLSLLNSIFDQVRAGNFPFALVAGEAGIGKTRLIREVERSAKLEGFRCLSAEPVELERRISMNPIIDALSTVDLEPHLSAIGEPWRTVIGTMLPPGPHAESVQALPPIQERSLSRRLLDAFSLLFQSLADEQPTIFFLDDLQWADATTVAALQFYQRRWNESYFGVVATVRPTLVGRKDAAAPYLAEDGKLGVLRVELEELSEQEARQLVEILGGQAIEGSAISKLCALSGRHPLYLTELTRDYLSGRLTLPDSEADAFNIPISLKQILASRMEAIGDDARSVLHVLAVGSRQMRLGDLAEILAVSLDCAADAAERLRSRQLIEVERDQLWIAHELFRTAIYRDLPEAHRAVLHHKLAEYIQRHSGEEAASELATHLDRAGRTKSSAQYGWMAAERAFERGAVAEAAHFYELVTRNEDDPARRAEATAMLATSLHLNRDISRANPALELASTRLRSVGMAEKARRMDIRRVEGLAEAGDTPVDELMERLGTIKEECRAEEDWEGVALVLDAELQRLQLAERLDDVHCLCSELKAVLSKGDDVASAIAHQGLAVGLMLEQPGSALASARRAVSLTTVGSADRRLRALNRLLIVLLHQGILHLQTNQEFVAEAETLVQRSGDLLQRFSFESNLGVSYLDSGRLDRAEHHFDRAGGMLGNADMTFPRINLAFNRGELALARRDFETAAYYFASAGEHGGLATPKYTEQLVNAGMGLCALETGKIAKARRHYELLDDPPPTWYYDPTPVLLFRARFLERRRDLSEAIHILRDAQADLEGRLVAAWIKTQLTLVRLMCKAGDTGFRTSAQEGLQVANGLGMKGRENEFRALLT